VLLSWLANAGHRASRCGRNVGDRDRLQQAVTNLLENCRRYAGSGAEVSVRVAAGPGHVVLEVEDTGPGVPAESLPHLFDRLYRVEKSRSRELGGSGLGLAICKQIVLAHNGEIGVRNRAGGGLAVTIVLPLCGRHEGV
jgi:two-component system sensor histidine kinase BaeS